MPLIPNEKPLLLAVMALGLTAIIAIAAYFVLTPAAAPPVAVTSPLSPLAKGNVAGFIVKPEKPPVAAISFKDAAGKDVTLKAFEGRVVLLNLWATWCAPCRKEMPGLNALQKEMGGSDFQVVALSLDLKGLAASEAFLKEVGADALALYIDEDATALDALQAPGLPTTLLIDRQGRELGRLLGPAEWNSPEAKALIAAAVAEKN